jgi:hypothetical protein
MKQTDIQVWHLQTYRRGTESGISPIERYGNCQAGPFRIRLIA